MAASVPQVSTVCSCKRPVCADERAIDMGIVCLKCGKNAENRLLEILYEKGSEAVIPKWRREVLIRKKENK